jgi:cell division protein FtsW
MALEGSLAGGGPRSLLGSTAGALRSGQAGGAQGRRSTAREPLGSTAACRVESRILTTATLCLLAFGAVMVYSASSPVGVLQGSRFGTSEFVRYLLFGALGLGAMQVLSRRGLALLDRRLVGMALIACVLMLAAVLAPGLGVDVNGARRWLRSGPVQFQPSELAKLVLVLWTARYLAEHPKQLAHSTRRALAPLVVAAGPACLLIVLEPDLGTALVIVITLAALSVAAGIPLRHLVKAGAILVAAVLAMALLRPYQMARLTSFLHPWAVRSSAGFQETQAQISLGSGGLFGVGLGQGVQKIFYLPEAQTDFILGVIGEELGVVGIFAVALLYGMIAFAGLRIARRAGGRYEKLLAAGLTSLILCQAILNMFVVVGLAPLTGVPLPFISYAPTNLCVMLASVGLLQNIARLRAPRLRAVDATRAGAGTGGRRAGRAGELAAGGDRGGRDGGSRRPGAGGGGRPDGPGRQGAVPRRRSSRAGAGPRRGP